jgi:glycosyltransferase involved in cell wall biosynthesis
MSEFPLVSVGMPVYNGENFLRQALDSLLAQDYPNFELLISDNASEDNTQKICLEYAARDKRIIYHRHENNMVAVKNFNWVFGESSGKYFMWAAFDDLWHPSFISNCVSLLEKHENAVLCITYVNFIDEDSKEYQVLDKSFDTLGLGVRERVQHLLRYSAACTAMYGLMRRDYLTRTHLFRKTWYPDFCLLFELSLLGEFVRVPKKLFFYREFRKKREKGLLKTMQSICDSQTRAPNYPFTGIYLMTQAWKELYKAANSSGIRLHEKVVVNFDITRLFFRLWILGIFREHKVRFYSYYNRKENLKALCSAFFCILFNPLYVFNYEFFSSLVTCVVGSGTTGILKRLKPDTRKE